MRPYIKLTTSILSLALSSQVLAFDLTSGKILIQVGGFNATQGRDQDINIQTLIGDRYTLNDENDQNALFGLGYFLPGLQKNNFNLSYGINAFYLAKTTVNGNIIQEHVFNNLAYRYNLTHVPVYAAIKAEFENDSKKSALVLDAGIGPNFTSTSNYHETSLDGVTIPDRAFSGKSNTTFSAMAGIGIKFNNLFGTIPLECGYRFFYLGEGQFKNHNTQIVNTLNTGGNYAQAIVCGITVL